MCKKSLWVVLVMGLLILTVGLAVPKKQASCSSSCGSREKANWGTLAHVDEKVEVLAKGSGLEVDPEYVEESLYHRQSEKDFFHKVVELEKQGTKLGFVAYGPAGRVVIHRYPVGNNIPALKEFIERLTRYGYKLVVVDMPH